MSLRPSTTLVALALLSSCSGGKPGESGSDSATPRGDCNPVDDGGCLLPFPSSFYLDADASTGTGYRVAFGPTSLPTDKFGVNMKPDNWNVKDGFSTLGPLYALLPGADVHSPGSLNFDTLANYMNADVTTIIVDADTGERIPHYIEREAFPTDATRAVLVIHPAVPLEHAHRYVVGIRNLLGTDGQPVAAPAGFAALRDSSSSSDPDVQRQVPEYESVVFPALTTAGFDRASLQLAWDFVTVSADNSLSVMKSVRDDALTQVPAGGPPYHITNMYDDNCQSGGTVGRTIEGTETVPFYLEQDAPGTFLNRPDGTADGPVVQNGTVDVPFTIVVPCSVLLDPRPSLLIQAGHGLFGDHTDVTGSPFADVAEQAHAVIFATSWRGMSHADYNAVTLMMASDPSDFTIIPDGLTQGHIEALLMARLMQGDLANDGALEQNGAKLVDPSVVDFYGVSLGSVLGGAQVAMSPTIQTSVMQISGMPFSLLLTRSADFQSFLALLGAKYDDPVDISLIVPLAQMLWDPTEAGGWAHYLADGSAEGGAADRRFLFQVGIGDDTVTSIAGEQYARSAGAGLLDTAPRDVFGVSPVADPTQGSGLLEWDYGFVENPTPAPAGLGDSDPHGRLPGETSAQAQVASFFNTGSLVSACDGTCDPD